MHLSIHPATLTNDIFIIRQMWQKDLFIPDTDILSRIYKLHNINSVLNLCVLNRVVGFIVSFISFIAKTLLDT